MVDPVDTEDAQDLLAAREVSKDPDAEDEDAQDVPVMSLDESVLIAARWERTPKFEDGRPVQSLDWNSAAHGDAAGASSARVRLTQAVEEAGFVRPDPTRTRMRR